MINNDFSNILLNRTEFKLLKSLSRHPSYDFNNLSIKNLVDCELANHLNAQFNGCGKKIRDKKIVISDFGKKYLLYHKRTTNSEFFRELRNWITTIIALLGFVLSCYSLWLQQ